MEVKAAAAAGAVQRFAHKIQPRTALELEGPLHFFQREAAAGGLGLLPAAEAEAAEAPRLAGMGQFAPVLRPQLGGFAAGKARRSPEGVPQAAVQHPLPAAGECGQTLSPLFQQGGKVLLGPRREKVHCDGRLLRAAAGGQQPRQLHDADAGQTVIGELDLPFLPGQGAAALPQGDGSAGPQPGKGFQLFGFFAAQRGQAGVQRLYPAASPSGHGGAKAAGAELRPGAAPQSTDHFVGHQKGAPVLLLHLDGVAASFLAHAHHAAAGAHGHAQRVQPAHQQAGQVRSLIGVRIEPAGFIGPVDKAQPLPPGGQARGIDGGQQPGQGLG